MGIAKPLNLAIVDDHTLFRKGMISLLELVGIPFRVLFEASNGKELMSKIDPNNEPDIVLLDINMPGMDGPSTVQWLRDHHPLVKVLVVSMVEKEQIIVQMLKLGVKGYICKDVEPKELGEALTAIQNKGFYYTDFITGKLVHSLQQDEPGANASEFEQLNDREKEFLQWVCSDLTYTEIAAKMFLSPKTIDGYRNALFEKMNVKSRVGLALFAVKHGLVKL